MGTDSADPSRSSGRRARSDLEEGEFVASDDESAGSDEDSLYVVQHRDGGGGVGEFVRSNDDSAGSDGDSRAVVQHRHGGGDDDARPEIKGRRLEGVVVDGGALPSSPTPSRERDSDRTISGVDDDADAGTASLAQGPHFFPCPVCEEKFRSEKAARDCGHMRVHVPHGRQHGKRTPTISGGWAVTAKRSSVIDPTPFAFASRSSSADEPNDDSMAILGVSSDNSTNQVVVHPPCSPQFLQGHKPAAPQVVVAQAQPTVVQDGQQLPEAAPKQFVVHQPTTSQVVARHVQPTSPPPPTRDEQGWWLCKEKGCGQRFATHHVLGRHMLGHKIRKINEAAAASQVVVAQAHPRNRKGNKAAAVGPCAMPEESHPCKHCPCVFISGSTLGEHMKKHYEKVISKKRGARPKVSARELATALTQSLPMPPADMEVAPEQPDAAPSVPVVLRLFGVNIVPGEPPASAAEETSSAVTETDQSSSASTNHEQ